MSQQKREHNPLRYRRVWWTEPGFILFSLFYLGSGFVGIRWIGSLGVPIIAVALGVYWLVMFPVMIGMYKRILDEPKVYVKQSVIKKTVDALRVHRATVRKEFIAREIEQLKQGSPCDVLDIWKIDPRLSARHTFFAATRVSKIDPSAGECLIRI
jgi:hypothetical protein